MDAVLEIAARLGTRIPEAYRDGVAANYERLLQQAALVMAAPVSEASQDHQADFVP